MTINGTVSLAYNATVGLIAKLVKQYIGSGELADRFGVFTKDAVEYGKGFTIATVLGAKKQNDGSSKAEEHGAFPPKVMESFINKEFGGQYAVTLDPRRVNECVGDAAAAQAYAAELTESLYQGWYRDKNKAIAAEAKAIIDKKGTLTAASVTVQLGTDVSEFAADVLRNVKAKVEDLKEGITGTGYGNTFVADDEIASRDIVIVMSNDLAATLDVYGFAKAFSPEYLEENRVMRVTSNKIPANTVLITDARNIQVRDKFESVVDIMNSDGSTNIFYNKYQYIASAIADMGTYEGQVAFPFVVISTEE